jgi:glycosyltransferase involved in cell wall biosynthesis
MLVRCLAMMRGGGETRHLAWARELTAMGVDVDVITGRPLLAGPRYPIDDLPSSAVTLLRTPYARDFVYRHQQRRGFGRLTALALHADEEWFCRAARRAMAARRQPPDVVHAHALHQAARLRAGDAPVVINLPGEPHARYRRDLGRADALVADGWAAEHLPGALGLPIDRIPKGVDAGRFRPDGPSVRDALQLGERRVVLAASRLVPIKNVRLLVDAVALVRARVPDVHLLIVGDGPERAAVRTRVSEHDLVDCVTFAGAVAPREMPAYYRAADVLALSSDFDNSPNVVLEAMASGLPVVATDAGGVREMIDDPRGGTIVARGDARALARAIERFLMLPGVARAAGGHNRQKAATEFSWRASAARLLDVYHRVVEARASRRGGVGAPA